MAVEWGLHKTERLMTSVRGGPGLRVEGAKMLIQSLRGALTALGFATTAAVAVCAGSASAVTIPLVSDTDITTSEQSFGISVLYDYGALDGPGGDETLVDIDLAFNVLASQVVAGNRVLTFGVTIFNNTSGGPGEFEAFGFDTDPNATIQATSSGWYPYNGTNEIPGSANNGGSLSVENCASSASNQCQSANGAGVSAGAFEYMTFQLGFAGDPYFGGGTVNLTDFVFRVAELNEGGGLPGSLKLVSTGECVPGQFVPGQGVQNCVPPVTIDPIPVPATLPLLAGGLALAGFVMRRRRKDA